MRTAAPPLAKDFYQYKQSLKARKEQMKLNMPMYQLQVHRTQLALLLPLGSVCQSFLLAQQYSNTEVRYRAVNLLKFIISM